MAKSSKKRSIHSTTRLSKTTKKKVPRKRKSINVVQSCDCCVAIMDAMSILSTGDWGILYMNAAHEWECLPGPAAEKYLKGNANNPGWSNT